MAAMWRVAAGFALMQWKLYVVSGNDAPLCSDDICVDNDEMLLLQRHQVLMSAGRGHVPAALKDTVVTSFDRDLQLLRLAYDHSPRTFLEEARDFIDAQRRMTAVTGGQKETDAALLSLHDTITAVDVRARAANFETHDGNMLADLLRKSATQQHPVLEPYPGAMFDPLLDEDYLRDANNYLEDFIDGVIEGPGGGMDGEAPPPPATMSAEALAPEGGAAAEDSASPATLASPPPAGIAAADPVAARLDRLEAKVDQVLVRLDQLER